jgi:dTDP-4-dehydrorhamnose 3,5-epimerase-like enzyme
MSRRRKMVREPKRCVCQPGPDAHHEHAKPGRTRALHYDPRCPHWDRSILQRGPVSEIVTREPRKQSKPKRLKLDIAN